MFTKLQYINPYMEMFASQVLDGKMLMCVCVRVFFFFLKCVCVPKCDCVCLLPSNKWCMCKLGKFLLYLLMQIVARYLLWSHGVTCSPIKLNKDLLKGSLLMCRVNGLQFWGYTVRVRALEQSWNLSIVQWVQTFLQRWVGDLICSCLCRHIWWRDSDMIRPRYVANLRWVNMTAGSYEKLRYGKVSTGFKSCRWPF